MGRPRKRRRGSDTVPEDANLNQTIDGNHSTDHLDIGPDLTLSSASSIALTTTPSMTISSTDAAYTTASDGLHTIDPALDPSSAWHTVHLPDLGGYDFASNPATETILNIMEDVGIPGQYSGHANGMQNAVPPEASCSCLDRLYSILQAFRSLPSPSFPASRGPLTKGTHLAREVIRCPSCPLDFPSALQTSMLLTTLIRLVVYGYSTLIEQIQAQAAAGQKITYRVGDTSLFNAHLHTGTLDCPMGFNIELEPDEWAALAKKVLKQDVHGNSQTVDCLAGVIEEMEQRHQTWHLMQIPFNGPDTTAADGSNDPHELFLQLIRHMRAVVDALEL
ncbi:MAG: hypothetical protein L6R40_002040 [Gallowayella cf. fulva]|nr:MAG: hypothetical protein L6R40_002040 [Xanthomendoza cf. fulva]